MSFRKRALFLAGLLAAVSCSDAGTPVGPGVTPEPGRPIDDALQVLDCSLSLESGSLRCTGAQPGTGAASGLIVGGQNLYVTLAGSNIQRSGNTVSLDVTVRNLIPQTLGVDADGATDADSVQVFFHELRDAAGAGVVQTDNADGTLVSFDGQQRPFFRYEPLAPGQTSAPQTWTLSHAPGVTNVGMKLYVAANVKHPQGWVDITPNSALLATGETATLADTVRDVVGRGIQDDVTWSSSNPAIVTVTETSDSTAQIQAVSQGTAWIRAQSLAASVRKDSILVTVNNAPVLNLDSISAISNVTMPVDSAHGMLANDSDDEKLTVSAGAVTTDAGGTATLAANGGFTYLSKPGYAGLDTIRYTVTDGARALPGKAVVRVENSRYWFVRAAATGDGRDSSPFGTLAAAQDSAVAGDTIFVLANGAQQVDGPVTLDAGQAVIGQGIGASIGAGTYNGAAITLLAAGAAPELTNTAAGATITLGSNNVIRGVGVTAAGGAAIAGTGFGTLFVRETGVNPAGPALHLTTGNLDAVFALLSSTGSATQGIYLNGVTGSLAGTGHVQNAAGTAVDVDGGSANLALAVQVTNTAGLAVSAANRTGGALTLSSSITDSGNGISVTGNTGGSIELSGALSLTGSGVSVGSNTGGTISFNGTSKTISTGATAGVSLTGNTGAAVQFGGGGLAVSTTSGAGFTATAGGTVSVTGGGNTVASTTGTAVTLSGVGTGASGVSLASVSANGAANGIVLSGVTGAGLQVTGVGAAAGSGGTVQNTTSHAVSLGSMTGADSVSLKHMTVNGGNAGTAGIFGSDFGTLRVTDVSVSATGGPALSLASGTLNGGFSSLGSAGSASGGVILTSVGGSFTAAAGTITGAASTAFAVAGGSVSATIAGSIAQASALPVVAVSGSHNGALTFETGTVSATNGTGLVFNAAAGTYAFNGTTTLNGGDAGIDITNGSTGSFTFGTGASVTSPTGAAFTAYGSSPTVVYNGNLTKGNAGLLVDIGEVTGGTVTFQTGTLSATAGLGISLSNADGAAAFNGTTTLNGGDAGVDVVSGSGGAISFGTGASITNPTGTALNVSNGGAATNLAYAGSISANAGPPVSVTGVSGGAVTVSGNITSTAQGITVAGNTGGAITFSGASKSLTTGANPGVSLTSNSGATVTFGGGGLAVSTNAGAGFSASGGGTVQVTGAGNTIASITGTALSLANVATGASGVNLASLSANGAPNGITLSSLTGPGVQVNGGSIQATTGAGVSLTSLSGLTTGVELSGMTLSRASGSGAVISGTAFGTLSLPSTSITAMGGPGALNLNMGALNGTINTINASGTGAATHAVSLVSVSGAYTVSGGTITGSANGDALNVSGGNATATWTAPALTSTSTSTQALDISSTTGGSYTFGTVNTPNTSGGVRLVSNAGSVTFSGLTLGNSGARYSAAPISLQMGSGNVSLGAVSIFTTGGAATGLGMTSAAASGTLSVASGTIDAAGSPAVNIAPSSGTQSVNVSLTTVNANGGTSGVILSNTSGSLTVTGSGSTAGSGGVVQNTTGSAVSLTSASNVQMSLMNLQPDASGWMASNLSGVNKLERSTVDYLSTAPGGAYAFRVANTNTNSTVTLDGTTFQNKMDGTTSVSISAMGSSVITFNVLDNDTGDAFPSRYRNLFGSGIVVGAGDDVGSTAMVTANISNTSFQDAPANGLNNLELGVSQNGTLVPNITNNVFDKVALPLATVGVINLNATVMGRVGSNSVSGMISNNSITNIRSSAGPAFAFDAAGTNGYVGMRVAIDNDAAGVNHKLQIVNNTITNVARQGVLISARGAASNVNVRLQGNTVGTLSNPVGTPSARRGVEIEAQTTATLKVEVVNNPSIVGGTSGSNSALHFRAGVNAGATATVHATVTGNSIANPNAGTNDGRFRAETVVGNSGTMCLDLRGNALESAAKEFQTNNNGGTYNRNASSNTGAITTVGAVGAVGACTLPSF